jgi:glycosyltransferase involved in cell wall biosynthesis
MKVAILHYSIPPVVGGVEAVIQAHTGLLLKAGFSVRLIAGIGEQAALPLGAEFIRIPEMDSRHPVISNLTRELNKGVVPASFDQLAVSLEKALTPALQFMDIVIIHNIFTKHFNLPLTAALTHLLDSGDIKNCIAWCHDFTWTSPHSRMNVHPGYPWDLLRTYRKDVTYVTISRYRQEELAGLYRCPTQRIHIIYDGVDPVDIYSLSEEGKHLIERLDLLDADLILLMPVRITQAKNIEFALRVITELKGGGMRPKLLVTGPPDPHDPADLQYYQSLLDLRRKLRVENEVRFVYESGPIPDQGYTIDRSVVRQLLRVCDVLFMPSHREGFGMPILEAGMVGMPIFTTSVPAAQEIGGGEVMRFSSTDPPEKVAGMILSWAKTNPTQLLRQRIRQNFTWPVIFRNDILPLLTRKEVV